MSAIDDIEFKIARLDLRPGDILVFKCKERLPSEAVARMRYDVGKYLGGHRALVLDGGLDIAVLTAAEIESRSSSPSDAEDAA